MNYTLNKNQAKEMLENKLSHFFGVNPENASYDHYYRSVAMILRDMMVSGRAEFEQAGRKSGSKKVFYLSMEFLMGRSLKNNLYNLNLEKVFGSVLEDYGVPLERLYDCEPDAGLGNGGLGRLAACYLDSLATQGFVAKGHSILYEYGIFKQKLVNGWQTELPDFWLPGGEVWLVARKENAVDICFEGHVRDSWDEHYHHVELVDAVSIKAIPYDMYVSGKDGEGISVLRLWRASAPGLDMNLFNQGDYMRAMERNAMAEVISKVLYPSDNHPEGKSLRLKQQYFLVSASVQDIVREHLRDYGTLDNFADSNAIHINDTHPTMAIPELMRILLDECGYAWDDAWGIVEKTMAYTNHTVMQEALEAWDVSLLERLLPRIYQIIREIDNRARYEIWKKTHDPDYVERTAIISNNIVRMANLCTVASHSTNGVSALHSNILKETVFNDFYRLYPAKFKNVTNGIAHRRWIAQANPELTAFLKDLIGDKFIYDASALEGLKKYADDESVRKELLRIKHSNKERLAEHVFKNTGTRLDPNSIFDIQIKRLHEYKRQHLNALNILTQYLKIKENPRGNHSPHTYIFGAKAASGYFMAKKIISFIVALSKMINKDPEVNKYLKVFYYEDYNVTAAELLMPAADISEQISLAGTEASGTGNMKFMLNGAITLGTMDGANVEIYEAVGKENIIIFGMNTHEVAQLKHEGYVPRNYALNNPELHKTIDFIDRLGVGGQNFSEISGSIVHHDPYMVLADFADYRKAQQKAEELYRDSSLWAKMSLMNTASAGRFAADRSINDYARDIWQTKSVFEK